MYLLPPGQYLERVLRDDGGGLGVDVYRGCEPVGGSLASEELNVRAGLLGEAGGGEQLVNALALKLVKERLSFDLRLWGNQCT